MARGPLTWTEDRLREIVKEEIAAARRPAPQPTDAYTAFWEKWSAYQADSIPLAPPGWSSWPSYAKWRIDGLLVAVNRWRDRAERRRLDQEVQIGIIDRLEREVLALQQRASEDKAAVPGERVGSVETVDGVRFWKEIPGPNLIDGLLDMIGGGRLKESDLPDDWAWLRLKLGANRVDLASHQAWAATRSQD